jgi:hypothetical protein
MKPSRRGFFAMIADHLTAGTMSVSQAREMLQYESAGIMRARTNAAMEAMIRNVSNGLGIKPEQLRADYDRADFSQKVDALYA